MIQKVKNGKKILLVWYQVGDNFGDVLLYNTTKKYLIETGYEVEKHEIGDATLKIAEHANKCNFLLFAGGGIVERYVPKVIREIRELKKNLDVPYGVIGLGIGKFDYSAYKEAFTFWIMNSQFFYVRDKATMDYFNILSNSDKAVFSGDVVFGNDDLLSRKEICKTAIGLNLRDIPYRDVQGDFDWKAINSAISDAGCTLLIPDCNGQADNLVAVFNNMEITKEYELLDTDSKVEKSIAVIQQCQIVVAMRFHVVLVAALLRTIPIPILYCPKVAYLAEQLGISDLAVELGEWGEIPDKVNLAKEKQDFYLETLENNIKKYSKKVKAMYLDVLECLKTII